MCVKKYSLRMQSGRDLTQKYYEDTIPFGLLLLSTKTDLKINFPFLLMHIYTMFAKMSC